MSQNFNSKFKRAFELTKMATKIGLKEFSSGSVQSRIEQAKILTESLSQLRGAAMKAGQILSLDLDDYFPPEAIQILSQLQNSVAEVPQIDLKKILIKELGTERFSKISRLTTSPFAAASMGQVYKAQIQVDSKNLDVVFKVLYPGLQESVASDVSLLKTAMKAFCSLTGRQMDLDPLFEEIQTVLENEVDYEKEKNFMLDFHQLFLQTDWKYAKIKIPTVYSDFCSSQVLCLSYESGLTLRDWMLSKPSLEHRELIASSLLELYMTEFFKWGYVQTDPNPSNFLIRNQDTHGSNGQPEIIALDFGASKKYPKEFRQSYVRLLKAIHSMNDQTIMQAALDFNLIDQRESAEALEIFIELLKFGIKPFQLGKKFQFNDDSFLKENSRLSRELLQKLKYSPPPHQLIFLHRKLGGVYAILRKLEVEIDVNEFWHVVDQFDEQSLKA